MSNETEFAWRWQEGSTAEQRFFYRYQPHEVIKKVEILDPADAAAKLNNLEQQLKTALEERDEWKTVAGALAGAVVWMSGATDFAPGEQAHEGWQKLREGTLARDDALSNPVGKEGKCFACGNAKRAGEGNLIDDPYYGPKSRWCPYCDDRFDTPLEKPISGVPSSEVQILESAVQDFREGRFTVDPSTEGQS